MKSSAARGLYAFCLAHGISRSGDNSRLIMFHVLALATLQLCWGGAHQFVCILDGLLEGLRRDEIVQLNTYVTGRLRAMPPPATAAATGQMSAVPAHAGRAGDSVEEVSVGTLAERVGDFNIRSVGADRSSTARVGVTPAPDCDFSPGTCSTTTSRHYSPESETPATQIES